MRVVVDRNGGWSYCGQPPLPRVPGISQCTHMAIILSDGPCDPTIILRRVREVDAKLAAQPVIANAVVFKDEGVDMSTGRCTEVVRTAVWYPRKYDSEDSP